MNFRHKAVFAIIASIGLCMLSAHHGNASGGHDFSRDHVIAMPKVAEAEIDQASSTSWNPLTAAKRTVSKAAAAAISGARRITKGITGPVGKLFDSDEGPTPKSQPAGLASKEATDTPTLEQQRSAPAPAMAKDQLLPQAEAMNKPIDASAEENNEKPNAPVADIAAKAGEPISPTTPENRSAIKLAAKPAGADDKLTNPQCEKAKAMISKYAFAEVEATSCKGGVYHFIATRDGKKFLIKVSARKGNLLEVEKLAPRSVPLVDAGMHR